MISGRESKWCCLGASLLSLHILWDRNLKTAQKLGMETIRESFLELILRYHPTTSASKDVRLGDSLSAVKNLEEKLGVDLTSPRKQIMCSTKLWHGSKHFLRAVGLERRYRWWHWQRPRPLPFNIIIFSPLWCPQGTSNKALECIPIFCALLRTIQKVYVI